MLNTTENVDLVSQPACAEGLGKYINCQTVLIPVPGTQCLTHIALLTFGF